LLAQLFGKILSAQSFMITRQQASPVAVYFLQIIANVTSTTGPHYFEYNMWIDPSQDFINILFAADMTESITVAIMLLAPASQKELEDIVASHLIHNFVKQSRLPGPPG